MTVPMTKAPEEPREDRLVDEPAVEEPPVEEPPAVRPSLSAALEELSDGEQLLVERAVRAGRRGLDGATAPLTDVSLVHEFLKFDPMHDDASALQNIAAYTAPPVIKRYPDAERIPLPDELLPIDHPIGEVIAKRSSRRDFSKGPLSLAELGTLLERSYGVRSRDLIYNVKGFPSRFVPTTGGLQPIEVYLTVNAVEGLDQGLYHYDPGDRCLELLGRGNYRRKAVRSCDLQHWIDAASVVLYLTCDLRKLYWKYGRRSYRFGHVDLGIVAQMLHLVATALRLRSCMVAGYVDDAVSELLELDSREELVGLLVAVGRKPWEPGPGSVDPDDDGAEG